MIFDQILRLNLVLLFKIIFCYFFVRVETFQNIQYKQNTILK